MTGEEPLFNFAEWNPNPIIELASDGSVVYANLIARTQFHDLISQGLSHPLLSSLKEIIKDFKPEGKSELVVYNQEVTYNKKCFEQQIFSLPGSSIYIYMIDVTERNQLKTQAQFSDKLATIGMLATGVAHEVNNPITWILGNLILLQNYTNTLSTFSTDTNQHEIITKILEITQESLLGMEQIRDITKSLKELARINKAEMAPVDIHKILNMTITMATMQFKNRAYLERDFTKNLPPVVSNSGKLHQVFLNLLINASQAIPEGDVQHHRIRVSTHCDGNKLRIDVADTGQGIPPETLPRIFDPFFTTKTKEEGTGLGLSICQEIINELKGEIQVKSSVGKGSTFSVYLPLVSENLKNAEKPEAVIVYSEKKAILVVDNEPILLKLLHRILAERHHVTSALGGNAAIDIISENPKHFDLIITDLNMPDLSGADLYRYVAQKFPGLEKKFVFVTGGVEMPGVKAFLTKTGNPVLEKPFLPKEVLSLVDKVTSRP